MGGKRKPFSYDGIAFLALVLLAILLPLTSCSNPSTPKAEVLALGSYTVYFETAGGAPVPEKLTVTGGSKIKAPSAVKKAGFSLGGWCKDEDCTEAWNFTRDTVTKDMTLYANWKPGSGGGGGGGGRGGNTGGTSVGSSTGGTTTGGSTTLANPVVNWPAELWAFEGQTLGDITLPGNTGTPGSFTWVTPGTALVASAAIESFQMNFTPADTTSYNSVPPELVEVVVYIRVKYDTDLKKIGIESGWTLDKHYKQTDNITLTGTFPVIGYRKDPYSPFTGTYDGNGYYIEELKIDATADYQGMFGDVDHGIIKNITLYNCSVKGNKYVGGVVARLYKGTVENCSFSGTVSGTSDDVGGIVGNSYDNCTIESCYSTGTVSGKNNIGGVVGSNNTGSKLQNCYSTANVMGDSNIGGVAGRNTGTVAYCYSTSMVAGITGTRQYIGGIVGENATGSIKNCVALNSIVMGSSYVGRVTGRIMGGSLDNNYARSTGMSGSTSLFTDKTKTDKDGEDITSTEWTDPDWWENLGFTGSFWAGELPLPAALP